MSRANKVYAGVDIGNTKIMITVGEFINDKDFSVIGSTVTLSDHFEEGVVLNADTVASNIAIGVRVLSEKYNLFIEDVFFGYSGHIECRNSNSEIDVSSREAITQSDLDQLRNQVMNSRREGCEILDVSTIRYTLDDRIVKNPIGYRGYSLKADFLSVFGKSDQIEMLKNVARKANLKLQGIVLHQVAAARTLVNNEAKEVGVVVVDLGAEVTKVAVYYNNALLYLSNVRIGANSITNDIKKLKNISFNSATRIKHEFGVAHVNAITKDVVIPMEDTNMAIGVKQFSLYGLAQIIEARLDIIFDIVSNEISKSNFYDSIGYGALLTGGGSFLPKIAEHFTQRSGIESMVALPINESYLGDTPIMAWPYVAVSTGILLEGVERPFQFQKQAALFTEEEIQVEEGNNRSKSASPSKPKKKLFGNLMASMQSLFDDDALQADNDTSFKQN